MVDVLTYPSTIRPWDQLVGQMLYLARTKKEGEMKENWDMIERIADIAPERAAPPARPRGEGARVRGARHAYA